MKTTQGKVVGAYTALVTMSRKSMNSFAAFKLFKLKKKMQDVIEFQSDQEKKLVEELGGTISETGQILLSGDKLNEYNERHKELEEMECEIDLEGKLMMTMKETPEISPAAMEALDDFIDWRE